MLNGARRYMFMSTEVENHLGGGGDCLDTLTLFDCRLWVVLWVPGKLLVSYMLTCNLPVTCYR